MDSDSGGQNKHTSGQEHRTHDRTQDSHIQYLSCWKVWESWWDWRCCSGWLVHRPPPVRRTDHCWRWPWPGIQDWADQSSWSRSPESSPPPLLWGCWDWAGRRSKTLEIQHHPYWKLSRWKPPADLQSPRFPLITEIKDKDIYESCTNYNIPVILGSV